MQTNLYVILDTKAKAYNKPMHYVNEATAIRACVDALSDGDSAIGLHPEDYMLFEIGTYDDLTSEITYHEPLHVLNFHEITIRDVSQ